jgi:hypothetical protein
MQSVTCRACTDGRPDDPHGVGVSGAVSEMLTVGGTRELLFMVAADCSAFTHTESISISSNV